LENTASLRKQRRDIARIKTQMNAKTEASATAKKAPAKKAAKKA
jgi:hypothetical protein